ncbi:MAG TPA: ferredoxin--NADP reductase [Polyangiales bacterium]|nr:ferredoxin--NADP reductase [Polyangiales bacterium]
MSSLNRETVLSVRHWNDTLFSFTTTRNQALRFKSGHFVMVGMEVEGRPLLRAYSVASAPYEEHLEFYSIKVPGGPLTSRLQHVQPGDTVLVGTKGTGTLVMNHLRPGKRLYLLGTGTGLAPFLSVVRDFDTYERFEHVVLTHGVRYVSELGYYDYIQKELPGHEYLGELVQKQLHYYPTVTREPYPTMGRLTDALATNRLSRQFGLPDLDPEHDRVMICGNPDMLDELVETLETRGFREGKSHEPAEYTIERAFVER